MEERTRPTILDVAARAGVSPATVSRFFSQPDLLRPDKRERVGEAVNALGYLRDGAARALVSGRTKAIGIIVPTIDNAIFSRAIQTLQSELSTHGYRLLVASHEYSQSAELTAVRSLLEHGIDALALVGTEHSDDLWALLKQLTVPYLLTWSTIPGHDCVGFDNHRAGKLAAQHLLRLGHRTIGMVSGHLDHNDRAAARIAGVRDALAAKSFTLPDRYVSQQPFSLAGGRQGLTELLALDPQPTAIIGGNDLLAAGALFEAQALGLHVPKALSIVGIDDLELSRHVTPALTTVHLPTGELGKRAAEVLLERIQHEGKPRLIELPVRLITRASTGPVGKGKRQS